MLNPEWGKCDSMVYVGHGRVRGRAYDSSLTVRSLPPRGACTGLHPKCVLALHL